MSASHPHSGLMQAAVRRGTGDASRVELAHVTRPTSTTPGHVVVRVTAALLTPLEREVVRGLGHEVGSARILGSSAVGVVEDASAGANVGASVGRGVDTPVAPHRDSGAIAHTDTLKRGTRVAIHPVVSCGACERCRGGLAMHCHARTILGIDDAHGGLAEFIAVPRSNLVAIPKDLDDECAVFAVSLARAMQAVRRSGVEGKTFASILGDDLLAILATVVAVEENPLARLVAAHEATLRVAEQFGIRHRALHETGRRGDQELVIDTTGSAETLLAAARMVRPRGHVIAAGLSARTSVAVDLSHIALDEIELHGAGFGSLTSALDRLTRRVIDPSALVARRVSLAEVPRALASLSEPGTLSLVVQVSR